ncbi:MAG: DUF5331 domain-containing protein [Leptolyngbyaceae cyanobacterium SU_3_3]|nr:DUF5331 domain-containing protein [Leptolyngbyaceae cyanobacterium SU_3_3]
MNIEHLRQSLKEKWLGYYQENRLWLNRLGVWVNCEGQRRPSSSFILSALFDFRTRTHDPSAPCRRLNSNPDRIVIALGLNFNPDEEIKHFAKVKAALEDVKLLPAGSRSYPIAPRTPQRDEDCEGSGRTQT